LSSIFIAFFGRASLWTAQPRVILPESPSSDSISCRASVGSIGRGSGAVGQQVHAAVAHHRVGLPFQQFQTVIESADRTQQIVTDFRTEQ